MIAGKNGKTGKIAIPAHIIDAHMLNPLSP